jgi:hypothetical protein
VFQQDRSITRARITSLGQGDVGVAPGSAWPAQEMAAADSIGRSAYQDWRPQRPMPARAASPPHCAQYCHHADVAEVLISWSERLNSATPTGDKGEWFTSRRPISCAVNRRDTAQRTEVGGLAGTTKHVNGTGALVLQIDCSAWCSRSCRMSHEPRRAAATGAAIITGAVTERGAKATPPSNEIAEYEHRRMVRDRVAYAFRSAGCEHRLGAGRSREGPAGR